MKCTTVHQRSRPEGNECDELDYFRFNKKKIPVCCVQRKRRKLTANLLQRNTSLKLIRKKCSFTKTECGRALEIETRTVFSIPWVSTSCVSHV